VRLVRDECVAPIPACRKKQQSPVPSPQPEAWHKICFAQVFT
jgi:hypothetical protein